MSFTKVKPSRKILDAIKSEILSDIAQESDLTQKEWRILQLLDGVRRLTRTGNINALQQVDAKFHQNTATN